MSCLLVKQWTDGFISFELEMAPLYPVVLPEIFDPSYAYTLVNEEDLLLGAMVTISSRYSEILLPERATQVHRKVAEWVRTQITCLLDGNDSLRKISSVEALLLLSEWPMLPVQRTKRQRSGDLAQSEEANLLKPSVQYDAYCWTNVGTYSQPEHTLRFELTVQKPSLYV